MALQMILRSGCLAFGILAGLPIVALPVAAQNAPSANQAAPARVLPDVPRSAAGVPAPKPQPRASDVPPAQDDSANSPYRETEEDAQMNRMIRNICRGC